MWLHVNTASTARAIYEAATGMLTTSDMSRIADRRARLEARRHELADTAERLAQEGGKRTRLHPRRVAYQLGKVLGPDAIPVPYTQLKLPTNKEG